MTSYPSLRTGTTDRSAGDSLVIVVFEDRPARGWSRWLPRGFRHCFCLIEHDDGWLLCDPLESSIRVETLPRLSIDELGQHFGNTGRHALLGLVAGPGPEARLHLRPCTCVEVVKRVLRISAPWVWTPNQLFRFLMRTSHLHRFMLLACPCCVDSVLS